MRLLILDIRASRACRLSVGFLSADVKQTYKLLNIYILVEH